MIDILIFLAVAVLVVVLIRPVLCILALLGIGAIMLAAWLIDMAEAAYRAFRRPGCPG